MYSVRFQLCKLDTKSLWACIFSTSRPRPLRGTSLTSLHRQALVFPVFVWLSITAASTSGILFSSGTQGKPNSATCSTKTSSTPELSLLHFGCTGEKSCMFKHFTNFTIVHFHSQTHKNTRIKHTSRDTSPSSSSLFWGQWLTASAPELPTKSLWPSPYVLEILSWAYITMLKLFFLFFPNDFRVMLLWQQVFFCRMISQNNSCDKEFWV